jgi:hypothetical protein
MRYCMKAAKELSIIIAGIAGLCGCTASVPPAPPIATPTASTSCPPEGSFVPFSKLMNPGFVSDYQGCNVTTTATFLTSGGGACGTRGDCIGIMVAAPGDHFPYHVALPKQGGDLAFVLKSGDTIILRGGTSVPYSAYASIFLASSIERGK